MAEEWGEEGERWSSNRRELTAVLLALQAYGRWKGTERWGENVVVRVKSDNTTTVSCLNKCFSRSPILLDIIGRIWKLTMLAGVEIRAEWIPGVENVTADWLSRWGGEDEASISFSWFNFFNDHWGPFTVDYMALVENAKVMCFFSCFSSLGAEGVEVLGVSWKRERAWVFPPFVIIGKVISHARRSEEEGVMIVPF